MAGLKWFWRLFLSSVWQRLQFRPPFNPSATSKGERKLQSFTAVVTGGGSARAIAEAAADCHVYHFMDKRNFCDVACCNALLRCPR